MVQPINYHVRLTLAYQRQKKLQKLANEHLKNQLYFNSPEKQLLLSLIDGVNKAKKTLKEAYEISQGGYSMNEEAEKLYRKALIGFSKASLSGGTANSLTGFYRVAYLQELCKLILYARECVAEGLTCFKEKIALFPSRDFDERWLEEFGKNFYFNREEFEKNFACDLNLHEVNINELENQISLVLGPEDIGVHSQNDIAAKYIEYVGYRSLWAYFNQMYLRFFKCWQEMAVEVARDVDLLRPSANRNSTLRTIAQEKFHSLERNEG